MATSGETTGSPTYSPSPSFGKTAQTASEMAKPMAPPRNVTSIVSIRNCAEDPALLRAEGHLDADLARPLLDHDVHDVRDADAADDEREHADDAEEGVEGEHEDVEELELLGGVPHRQRFFVVGVEAQPLSERGADALHDLLRVARRSRPGRRSCRRTCRR